MPATQGASVKVSLAGYTSQTAKVNVPPGFSTQQEFFLASGTSTQPPSSGGLVAGKITSAIDGRALGNARVTAGGQTVYTDSTGSYSIANLAAGTYTVSATLSGWLTNATTVSVVSGTPASANLKLATAGHILGTLKSSSGSIISGATITMSGGVLANTTKVVSSSTGNYSSTWIPVGTYTVTVSKSGYSSRSGTANVTAGGNFTLNFTM
jgi:hypothetical protein